MFIPKAVMLSCFDPSSSTSVTGFGDLPGTLSGDVAGGSF